MHHPGRRAGAALASLAAGCTIALAAAPAAARVTTNFVLDPPSASEPMEGEVEFGFFKVSAVILSRQAHAERAVKLTDSAFVDGGRDMIGFSHTADLKAGDVLTGSDARPGLYCRPAPRGAVCLEDADGDGRFERTRMALCDVAGGAKYDVIAWTVTGRVCPFGFMNDGVTLAAPLAYARMDPAQGPSAWANLTMNEPSGGKGKPLTFSLTWGLGEKDGRGNQIPGDIWIETYAVAADGVGKIDLHGMVVEFQGYTPDHKKLRYRVLTPMPSVRLQAWAPLRRGY